MKIYKILLYQILIQIFIIIINKTNLIKYKLIIIIHPNKDKINYLIRKIKLILLIRYIFFRNYYYKNIFKLTDNDLYNFNDINIIENYLDQIENEEFKLIIQNLLKFD